MSWTYLNRIAFLVQHASQLLQRIPKEALKIEEIISLTILEDGIAELLEFSPNQASASLSQLGGALYLVKNLDQTALSANIRPGRLENTFSSLFRAFAFSVELLISQGGLESLSLNSQEAYLRNLLLFNGFLEDNIAIQGSNSLWSGNATDTQETALGLVSRSQEILQAAWKSNGDPNLMLSSEFVERLLVKAKGSTSSAYYHARALSKAVSELVESGFYSQQQAEAYLGKLGIRKSPDAILCSALIVSFAPTLTGSALIERLQNELVSDLMGTAKSAIATEGLRRLVLLNSILRTVSGSPSHVIQRRVVMFIKHILGWVEQGSPEQPSSVKTEVTKSMYLFISVIDATSGSHWMSMLEYMDHLWTSLTIQDRSPDSKVISTLLYESLRLYSDLKAAKNANPDLQEGWRACEYEMTQDLMKLLRDSKGLLN
jgi:hypothetical protein